ncbi:hypothetical protein DUI87_18421 [Hirundo rustica rustica]|uniref:PH domain-containing protein n=1 Tax=Hirundo rustica rustica TaxID=333673 RepID=A0A3M0KDG3_HIRRU|nr:hypothetical protein DUI87_18421 [Hirundo rustica rustica]
MLRSVVKAEGYGISEEYVLAVTGGDWNGAKGKCVWKLRNVGNGSWRRRYFVLDFETGILQYFMNEQTKNQSPKPRGALSLAGAIISPSDEVPHMLVVYSANGEMYKLRAADAKEKQYWITQLRSCAKHHKESDSKNELRVMEFVFIVVFFLVMTMERESQYSEMLVQWCPLKTNAKSGAGVFVLWEFPGTLFGNVGSREMDEGYKGTENKESISSSRSRSSSLLPPGTVNSASPSGQKHMSQSGPTVVTITHHKSPAAARRAKSQRSGQLHEVRETSLLLYLLILCQVRPAKINGNMAPRGVNGMVKSLTLSV